ncbi:MAG: hypothetical protein II829_06335 [Bacteroidales bacterium]|nr:hypothetical protein [Bacteroidales bacterium]
MAEKDGLDISLYFYPSELSSFPVYSINIRNDSMFVSQKDNYDSISMLRLTHNQYSIVKSMASKLIFKYNWSDNWANDAWGCTLKVDNQVYYKDNNYSLNRTPTEIKLLINYIISLSPIRIDLYGFS